MPDIYARGDYDLAGFCVGVVERKHLIDGRSIAAGDVVLGSPPAACTPTATAWCARCVRTGRPRRARPGAGARPDRGRCAADADANLRPALRKILQHYKVKNVVHGIAHITGGGLRDNLERILPTARSRSGAGAGRSRRSYWLQELGGIDEAEMDRVFNMGIGLALVFSPYYETTISGLLNDAGLAHWKIGYIASGPKSVVWKQ